MKKTLIALAALAATGAFAQSSVTMYGNIDIAYGSAVTKAANGTQDKTVGVVDGLLMPNRIGFRGVEDLGSGLKAGFVLEQGVSPVSSNGWNQRTATSGHQTPNGGAFSAATMRAGNAFVSGGFGEVRVGTMNRAAYGVASKSIVMAENYGGEGHTLAATRTTAVGYTSPVIAGGVTAQVQYGSAHGQRNTLETTADSSAGFRTDNTKVLGAALNYNAGPLYLGAAYETTEVQRVANGAATTNAYGGAVAAGTAVAQRTEKLYALAASYDFGMAKVNFSHVNRDQVAAGKATSSNLSATVPLGAITLGAIVTNVEAETQAGAKSSDLSGYQVGAIYNLSKRSQLYIWRGHDKDKLAAAATQADRTRTAVGIQHSF